MDGVCGLWIMLGRLFGADTRLRLTLDLKPDDFGNLQVPKSPVSSKSARLIVQ